MKSLTYFLQVCQDKSFTRAANNLFISQQGLSASILRIEKELGCELFLRTPSQLLLTADGEYFKEYAEKVTQLSEECQAHFAVKRNHVVIRVALAYDLLGLFPSGVLNAILNQDARFHIQYFEEGSLDCESLVEKEECELAIMVGPYDPKDVKGDYLFEYKNCFLVNIQNPIAKKSSISIHELEKQKIICHSAKFKVHALFMELCRNAGFEPNIILNTDRNTLIHNIVKNNPDIIGRCADFYACNISDPHIKILYLNDADFISKVYLVYKIGHVFSEKEREFRKFILAAFRQKAKNNHGPIS